ncbi:hypothetical protein RHOFW510R12_27265 [Rhodanobacter sp. FW510-R12]
MEALDPSLTSLRLLKGASLDDERNQRFPEGAVGTAASGIIAVAGDRGIRIAASAVHRLDHRAAAVHASPVSPCR